jgi:hypothetical protein
MYSGFCNYFLIDDILELAFSTPRRDHMDLYLQIILEFVNHQFDVKITAFTLSIALYGQQSRIQNCKSLF